MEDCLIIGIDIAEGKDISCMSVIRKNGEEMQVINQLFNKEAEDIYYKLINVRAKEKFPLIQEEAIKRGMNKICNIYSYKEILETMKETMKLKHYTENERNYILNNSIPKKMSEILAVFWLTHTNDEFFNYFGFNWVPPMKLQEKARTLINTRGREEAEKLANMALINFKKSDMELDKEILKDIEKNITINFGIPKNYLKGATYE